MFLNLKLHEISKNGLYIYLIASLSTSPFNWSARFWSPPTLVSSVCPYFWQSVLSLFGFVCCCCFFQAGGWEVIFVSLFCFVFCCLERKIKKLLCQLEWFFFLFLSCFYVGFYGDWIQGYIHARQTCHLCWAASPAPKCLSKHRTYCMFSCF